MGDPEKTSQGVYEGVVGDKVKHFISMYQNDEGLPAIGNVLRRVCDLGGEACKQSCQLSRITSKDAPDMTEGCADKNLENALSLKDIPPVEVVMVGVTGNKIGFGENMHDYDVKTNPRGWKEVTGYNAFFVRDGEMGAIGRRLADCADINFELIDADGNVVFGFEHGTRTNMEGEVAHSFEYKGQRVSYTEYVIGTALDHYNADPSSMHIKLAAAIKPEDNPYHFDSVQKMEEVVSGWQAGGWLVNIDNSRWYPEKDGTLDEGDVWQADSYGLIKHDIQAAMKRFGIPSVNFSEEGIIFPASDAFQGRFSSAKAAYQGHAKESRDLYLTYISKDDQRF